MPIADDVKLGLANRFLVTVIPSNRSLGSWAKAEGLDVSWEVPDYRAGDSWNDRDGVGLGATEIESRWLVGSSPGGARTALIGRVLLPTGTGPYAEGGFGAGAQVVVGVPLSDRVDLFTGLGVTAQDPGPVRRVEYEPVRLHGYLALEWRLARPLSAIVETNVASRLVRNIDEYPGLHWMINIGGRLVHRDQAGVSPFDSVVQGGDAVWEGLRLYQGRIFKLTEHLDRLRHSALALAFTQIPSQAEMIDQIKRTLAANHMRDGVHIRLTLTRGVKITSGMDPRLNQSGPTLIVLAEFKPPVYDKAGITLITSSVRRFPPDCLDPKIHHNNLIQSILAKIEANVAGADDALLLDTRGFVAETNATHVFIAHRGELLTPRCVACPEGITRAVVLELCRRHDLACAEGDLSLTEVYRADEMFCTGTMGELVPVTRLDGRPIGGGDRPVLERLSALFAELTRREGEPVCEPLE